MTDPLRIHLFGQPRVLVNGAPYKFVAPPRTLPLLAFLLLNRDAHLTRDTIAFTLWPDDEEEAARTNLRRHLNYLKNGLPRDTEWFVTGGDTVGWNPESRTWLDVEEFERLVRQEDGLEQAVALYAGDILPALYDDWIIVTRDRLRSTYLTALDALLLRARSERAFAVAAGYARRILAEDPWREDALRSLISIRYESGDRTGALLEFDDFTRRLEREVGVEPMPETIALRDLVLRGAALPDAASDGREPDAAALPTLPFVGRRAQLETLQTGWARAARGRGSVVLVGGEAGIGKSRLAAELALFAGAQGGRVLRGSTGAPERVPYQSIAETLRAAAPMIAKLDVAPIWLAALGVLLPEVGILRADVPGLPALDPEREQARLFEALAITLAALAKARPLMLVLEDLHWAGASTLRAIEYLARRAAGQSWLIVGTYRSEEVSGSDALATFRRRLASENLIGGIALGGLTPDEVRELVGRMPPLAERSDALGRRIAAVSDGNPLFVGELVRDFLERGDVGDLAPKLEATIAARLERLDERSRTVAEIASVAGATFDVETIARVAGWSEHELFEATGDLLDRRIVREIGPSSFTYAFSHHLIAAALYARIPAERRARWHLRLASIVEHSPEAGTGATLAHHLAAAGEPERAAVAYLAASRSAFSVYANAEACELATRGLALHSATDGLRFELLALRERIYERLGDADARGADLAALEAVAANLGDGARDDAVLERRIEYEHARGERDAELRAIEQLHRRAKDRGDARALAVALEAEALYRRSTAEFDDAWRLACDAIERYRELGDDAGRARTLTTGALCAAVLGRPDAQTTIDAALRISQTAVDPVLRGRVLRTAATVALFRQDYPRFAEIAEQTLDVARSAGDRQGEAICHHQLGTAYWTAWRVRESYDHLQTAVRLCEELGTRDGVTRSLCNLGSLLQDCGLYDEARPIQERARVMAAELAAGDLAVSCELNLGLIQEGLGDAAAARDRAERALAESTRLGVKRYIAASLAQRGAARRRLGEIHEAIADLSRAVELAREAGRPADVAEWLGHAALAYLSAGRTDDARGAVEDALGATAAAFVPLPAQLYWVAAQVYHAAGDAAACDRALARAREEFRSRSEALPEERWRAAYAAIPTHREIVAAAERSEWPAL